MIAGVLEIQMRADVARLRRDMQQGVELVGQGARSIQSAANAARSALEAIGFGLGLTALVSMVKGAIDAADKLNDLTQSLGLNIQALAQYQLAAAQGGTSLEAIGRGIKGLSTAFAENGDALRAAGIDAATQDGKLRQLADVFAGMPDGIEKTTLAVKLFGKSGMELIPMLNGGSAGLDAAAAKSAKYAAVMAEMAPRADAFNDTMAELALATKVASLSMVSDALPAMSNIASAMAIAAHESGGLQAAWVGLGGIGWEFIFKPLHVIILGITIDLEELNAKMLRFFRQTKAAEDVEAGIARMYKQQADLVRDPPRPEPPKGFDTDAWTAKYKKLIEALGVGKKTTKEAVDEYEKLAKAAAKFIETLNTEVQQIGMTTIQKKMMEAATVALTLKTNAERMAVMIAAQAWAQATAAQELKIATDARAVEIAQAYIKEQENLAAQEQEMAAYIAATNLRRESAIMSTQALIDQLRFETTLIAMSNEQRVLAIATHALVAAGVNIETEATKSLLATLKKVIAEQAATQAATDKTKKAAVDLAEKLKRAAQDAADAWRKAGADIADSLTRAFGAGGAAIGSMVRIYTDAIATQIEIDDKFQKARMEDGADWVKIGKQQRYETTQNTVGMYANMAGAAAQYFDEQSDAYKILHGIERAMHMAKLAMQIVEIVGNLAVGKSGVAAAVMQQAADAITLLFKIALGIANQANGDPYSAFARMGAMAGIMVGVAAIAGVAFGFGGGSGGGQDAASMQAAQGRGTVVGDASEQSASLLNSLKEIEKIDGLGLIATHQMLAALLAIQDSMAGVASLIYRTTGLTTGIGLDVQTGSTRNTDPAFQYLFGADADPLGASLSKLDPLLGALLGSTTQTLTNSGLTIIGRVADLIAGIGISTFATVTTETGGLLGWLGLGDDGDETKAGAAPENLRRQFGLIFASITDAVEEAAKALELWSPAFAAQLRAFVVDIGNVSLKDLKGQELQDALNSIFSTFADQLATSAFSIADFEQFIQVGEGFFETMMRVASSNEYVKNAMASLGLSMPLIGMAAIEARMNMVDLAGGLEKFGELTADYYAKFFSPAEQHANLGTQLGTEFTAIGKPMPTDPAGFRALVAGLDLTTAAGQATFVALMRLAPAFYDFSTQMVGLDGQLHDAAEALAQHTDAQERYDIALYERTNGAEGRSAQQIKNQQELSEAIDQTNYNLILAAQILESDNAERAAHTQRRRAEMSLEGELMTAQGNAAGALANQRALDIEGMNLAQVASYDYQQSLRAQIAEQNTTNSLQAEASDLAIQLMTAEGNAAGALAATRLAAIEGLTAEQVALYDLNQTRRAQILATTTEAGLRRQLFALTHTEAEALASSRRARLAELQLQEQLAGLAPGTLTRLQMEIDRTTDLNETAAAAQTAHEALVNLNRTLRESFRDAERTITMTGMTNEQQYRFLQKESAGFVTNLQDAMTPADVQKWAEKIRANMLTAFNLLSPDEQTNRRSEYLTNLGTLGTWITDKLTELDPTGSLAEADAETPATRAANLQVTAAQQNLDASDAFNTAADKMEQAATAMVLAQKLIKRVSIDIPALRTTVEAGA